MLKIRTKLQAVAVLTFSLVSGSVFANLSEIQPLTKEEVHQGLAMMKQNLHSRIETWGATLKPTDFEKSFFSGRQLNKQKRQEVCGIYQSVIDDTYRLAVQNKARLKASDQAIVDDRNLFLKSLGFTNNIVDTQMGFNCRLR